MSDKISRLIANAKESLDNGKLDQAYQGLLLGLQENETNPYLNYLIGAIENVKGDSLSATKRLKTAITVKESVPDFWCELILSYILLGDKVMADKMIARAEEVCHSVNLSMMLENREKSYKEQKTKADAVEKLKADKILKVCMEAYKNGDYATAVALCANVMQALDNNRKLKDLLRKAQYNLERQSKKKTIQLVRTFLTKGSLDEAKNNLDRLGVFETNSFDYLFLSGVYSQMKGFLQKASAYYREALEINPRSTECLSNLGLIARDEGNLTLAIENFERSLEIAPNDAETLVNCSEVFRLKGLYQQAEASSRKALAINPNLWPAYVNLGASLSSQKKYSAALSIFKNGIQRFPDVAELYINSANALVELARPLEAIQHYATGWKKGGGNTKAINGLCSLGCQLTNLQTNVFAALKTEMQKTDIVSDPSTYIYKAIFWYMRGEYALCTQFLENYESVFGSGRDVLDSKSKVFCRAYHAFLKALLSEPQVREQNLQSIYHLGESHCLSYAHGMIKTQAHKYKIEPVITFGAKAYHFGTSSLNKYKSITAINLSSIPNKSKVFLSFGEIDCRFDEGLIPASDKLNVPLGPLVKKTVASYIDWFLDQNITHQHDLCFFNIPAPVYNTDLKQDENEKVAIVRKLYNAELREISISRGFKVVDVHKLTNSGTGFSNLEFHIDNTHLGPSTLCQISKTLT